MKRLLINKGILGRPLWVSSCIPRDGIASTDSEIQAEWNVQLGRNWMTHPRAPAYI